MKRFLMAAIAVLMMAGTAVAAEKPVIIKNNVTAAVPENAVDKLIALVKSYTQKINAAKDIDELVDVSMKLVEEMNAFEEKYSEEIMTLENQLTEEQKEAYEEQMGQVMAEYEAIVEKKSKELLGDYEDIDF